MTIVVLLFLGVLWALVLVPPALRARAESSPADSIGSFRRDLMALQRTRPGAPVPSLRQSYVAPSSVVRPLPVRPARATGAPRGESKRRRREILAGLLGVMGTTLVLGLLPPLRVLWTLHVVADILFVAYVGLLIHSRNNSAERDMKVRYLPQSAPEPAMLLRRTGNWS